MKKRYNNPKTFMNEIYYLVKMKIKSSKIFKTFMIVLLFGLIPLMGYSQTPGSIQTEGSLIICNGSKVTYRFEQGGSSIPISYKWTITPSNCGTILNQGDQFVQVIWNNLPANGNDVLLLLEANYGSTTLFYSLYIRQIPLPVQPANIIITPNKTSYCPGEVVVFTTSYNSEETVDWSLLVGATVLEGRNNSFIRVIFPNDIQSAEVKVRTMAKCGAYSPYTPPVTITFKTVGAISGPSLVCPNNTIQNYQITPPVPSGNTISWQVPAGTTITSGQGTSNIEVSFSKDAVSDSVIANITGQCGLSTIRYPVQVKKKLGPISSISGPLAFCPDKFYTYSIPPVDNADSYAWLLPAGATINGPSNTNRIRVNFGANPDAGTLTVTAMNADCNLQTIPAALNVIPRRTDLPVQKRVSNSSELASLTSQTLILNTCSQVDVDICSGRKITKATLEVKLNTGDLHKIGVNEAFTSGVALQIIGFDAGGATLFTQSQSLGIDQSKPGQVFRYDFTSSHPNVSSIIITPVSFTNPQGRREIQLTSTYLEEFDFNNAVVLTPNPLSVRPTYEQEFSWVSPCNQITNYQFQLVRLYAGQAISDIDWGQALSIETGQVATTLQVTVSEGSGHYYWRVRTLGNKPGGIANPLNWGQWSALGEFDFVQPDEISQSGGSNWIYSRTFTEGGRVSEKFSFANGLQQILQSQARLQSSKQIVVGVTKQDYLGRDALQSLPIPVPGKDKFKFENNLLKDISGNPYVKDNFDEGANVKDPLPAIESGYYSSVNTGNNAGVADAQGYPYTRTLFTPDATGRVKETSGVGSKLRLNTTESHTTKTIYTGVSDPELVMILGDEAPLSKNVHKVITEDNNGTTSIRYETKDGKTIATALSVQSQAPNLDLLDGEQPPAITETITEKTPFNGIGTSTHKPLYFDATTTVTIDYKITRETINEACTGLCASCDYQVELFIIKQDEDNPTRQTIPLETFTGPAGSCNNIQAIIKTYVQKLDKGSYVLEKRITSLGSHNDANGDPVTYLSEQLQAIRNAFDNNANQGLWLKINTYLSINDVNGVYNYLEGQGFTKQGDPQTGQYYSVPFFNSADCQQTAINIPYLPDLCKPKDCAVDKDFEAYFKTTIAGLEGNSQGPDFIIDDLSFTVGTLNTLIANMLADRYDCNKLWDCWEQQTDTYGATPSEQKDLKKMLDYFLECAGADRTTFYTDKNLYNPVYYYKQFYYGGDDQTFPQHNEHKGCFTNPKTNNSYTSDEFKNLPAVDTSSSQPTSNDPLQTVEVDTKNRHDIYNCLKNITPLAVGKTYADVAAQTEQDVEGECNQACEYRREEFRQAIINRYHEAGKYIKGELYVLQPDPFTQLLVSGGDLRPVNSDAYDIDTCQLDKMVESLVNTCKEDCNITVIRDNAGNITGIGTPEENAKIRNVLQANFEVSLTDATNGCGSGYKFIPGNPYAGVSPWKYAKTLMGGLNNIFTQRDAEGNYYFVGACPACLIKLNDGSQFSIASIGTNANRSGDGYYIIKFDQKGKLLWYRKHDIKAGRPSQNGLPDGQVKFTSNLATNGGISFYAATSSWPNYSTTAILDDGKGGKVVLEISTYPEGGYVGQYDSNGNLVWANMVYGGYGLFSGIPPKDGQGNTYLKQSAINVLKTSKNGADQKVYETVQIVNGNFISVSLTADKQGNAYHLTYVSPNGGAVDVVIGNKSFHYAISQANVTSACLLTIYGPNGTFLKQRFFELSNNNNNWGLLPQDNSIVISIIPNYQNPVGMVVTLDPEDLSGQPVIWNAGTLDIINFEISASNGQLQWGNVCKYRIIGGGNDGPLSFSTPTSDDENYYFGYAGYFDDGVSQYQAGYRIHKINKQTKALTSYMIREDDESNGQSAGFGHSGSFEFFPDPSDQKHETFNIIGLVQPQGNGIKSAGYYLGNYWVEQLLDDYNYSTFLAKWKYEPKTNCAATQAMCFKWTDISITDPVQVPAGMEDFVYTLKPKTCDQVRSENILQSIQSQVLQLQNSKLDEWDSKYKNTCILQRSLSETFTLTYVLGYQHYTLYYYDRAGNLIKTVPPAGVKRLDVGDLASARLQSPAHSLATTYNYNSLGQLVKQKTPDGGITNFYYNNKSQLRFSINARQATTGYYSYTQYDKLGRVTQVGESNESTSSLSTNLDNMSFPTSGRERTYTLYTSPFPSIQYPVGNISPRFLQNRVSYTYTENINESNSITSTVYTFYSYDPHGNVEWMMQRSPLGDKTIRYEYDLISGKVLKVIYQEAKGDQFFHQYDYDEDNRLTAVYTSTDGSRWDKDATYQYYAHGPLKRSEIGQDRIQGIDYTYTLQGWLKGVNHPALDNTQDPGLDGQGLTSKDVFRMSLGYFSGDYNRAGSGINTSSLQANTGRDLYNGNISTWASATAPSQIGGNQYSGQTGEQYTYDQLNRIKSSTFLTKVADTWLVPNTDDFSTSYSYDPNGNLLKLKRKAFGANNSMDDLSYTYKTTSGGEKTNQLDFIADAISGKPFGTDVSNQGQGNYVYDEIGNLVKDNQEGVLSISWTVYGKVRKVSKADGSSVSYGYDASGNRVLKTYINGANTTNTYYVRDAQGNVMAVYSKSGTAAITTDEQYIYGSDRLGVYKPYGTNLPADPNVFTRVLNQKTYELKDHLGNVRVVISDGQQNDAGALHAQLMSFMNYYAFGMEMPGRSYNSSSSRYGFNGKEKDPEFQNNYDYGERIYNASIGRFLTVDPLTDDYPFFSPYLFGGNDVISASDVDGLEPSYKQVDGTYVFARDGYLQRPLRDQKAIEQINKRAIYNSQSNGSDGKFAHGAVDLLFTLTPIDELNTLITGENPEGDKVSSFQAIFDLGMATTKSKGGGAPMKSPKLKAPNYKSARLNLSKISASKVKNTINKNSNDYVGDQAVYEITVGDNLFKYGKADATKINQITKTPIRLQSQINKLQRQGKDASGNIIFRDKNISTKDIKKIETQKVQEYVDKNGKYPQGNQNHPGVTLPKN